MCTVLYIQLGLHGETNCSIYIQSEKNTTVNITNWLSQGVEELCDCGFNSSYLSEEFINCFNNSLDHVTYRAVLTKTENVSIVNIASLISEWVSEGGSIIVQSTQLELTSSCPVVIADRDSPECPQDITNRPLATSPTTSPTPPSTIMLNIGAVAGGSGAGVLVITFIIMLLLVRVCRSRSKKKSKNINSTHKE